MVSLRAKLRYLVRNVDETKWKAVYTWKNNNLASPITLRCKNQDRADSRRCMMGVKAAIKKLTLLFTNAP